MKYIFSVALLLCLTLFNCKSQEAPKTASKNVETSLIGTKWILTKLNGDVLNLTNTELEQPFLKLTSKDNGVGGNGGCNAFGGTYTLKENQQIAFSQLLATMKYCNGNGIESVYMSNLQKATSYTISKNKLTFKDENEYALATFEASEEKKN